jgi:membrane protein
MRDWTTNVVGKPSRHKDARQGSRLAYYSVFSLDPIIVAICVAGLLFGHDAVSAQVMSSITEVFKP